MYEHKLAVTKLDQSSTLAQHVLASNHTIDFKNTNSIAQTNKLESRIIREAIEIEKRDHAMNIRDDGKRLPIVWHTIVSDRKITPTPILSSTLMQAQSPIESHIKTNQDTHLNVPTSYSNTITTQTNQNEPSFINRIITRSMSQLMQNFSKT